MPSESVEVAVRAIVKVSANSYNRVLSPICKITHFRTSVYLEIMLINRFLFFQMNKIECCFELYHQQITLPEEVSTDSDEKKSQSLQHKYRLLKSYQSKSFLP